MKFRSKFEARFADLLKANEIPFKFEAAKIPYTINHNYIPDFMLGPHFYLETKGRFTGSDRQKMKAVKTQNPHATVVIVFQDPNKTISKVSRTTYAQWCDKNGIEWCKPEDLCEIIQKHTEKLYKHLK